MYKLKGWLSTILGAAIVCISWGSIEAHDQNWKPMVVYILLGSGLLMLSLSILESMIKQGGK